ncbi:Proliferating cell nuclear antigen, partial [Giardia duodenalis]
VIGTLALFSTHKLACSAGPCVLPSSPPLEHR